MGKVLHGLDKFHIAELKSDDASAAEFETPESVPGAVNVSVNPNTSSNTFFADNGAYEIFSNMGDIDVDIEVADLPLALQKKIFGHKETKGVQFGNINDRVAKLALGFRAKTSTGGYRYYWFLKGNPELLPIEHQTDEDNITPQTAKLKLKFAPLQYNGNWKAQAEDGDTFTEGGKWFDSVVYDDKTVPSTPTP